MNQFTPNHIHELVLIRAKHVEEGCRAVLEVRSQKTVLLDLSGMDNPQAQRTTDFVCGGIETLDGGQHRLDEHVFLFTPSGIQVTLN